MPRWYCARLSLCTEIIVVSGREPNAAPRCEEKLTRVEERQNDVVTAMIV